MEPWQDINKLEEYRRKLGIHFAYANVNGKIWAFIDEDIDVDMMNMEQQMTLKLFHRNLNKELYVTLVYAKYDAIERIELWNSMYHLASDMEYPWVVGGDFNVILSEEEKYGGRPVYLCEVEDFAHCVDTSLEVEHLIKYGSDHAPLLLSCNINTVQVKKPFKFLNFRTKHESFLKVVKDNWIADSMGNPFILFQSKLRKALEDVIKVHEIEFELNPTARNTAKLHKVEADLTRYYHLEEEFWRQKAGMQWFKDGDRNTKFLFDHVRGKRKTLQVSKILDKMIIGLNHKKIWQGRRMVSQDQNAKLWDKPTIEEVKATVFELNGDSASGPDGFTGQFYQASWEVICDDVLNMVRAFFCGAELPKFITHTNFVLLPKKKNVATFSDMRPISLSNFSNKIISRVIHERLVELLPSLISPNQAGFVKGRSIVENILLTQDIIKDIRLRGKPSNVVIKLDMAKAYDRVLWLFLTKVLRQMGFGEIFIDMIFRLVSNNWYSVLLNGQANGFFKSSTTPSLHSCLLEMTSTLAPFSLESSLVCDGISWHE
ncbi:uncharacterized protein LOC142168985 [Nicotiana tabacum]|uniref:Uncharacterized protein LOC142168985 n=1 Tax=Nicotiana tabacum TaxID=4097 RepID=A0AC58SMS2_TOBAC